MKRLIWHKPKPSIYLDDFLLIDDDCRREPVVTIRKSPGGVMLDYCHDRLGDPFEFCDEPKCAVEATINKFGWSAFKGDSSFYVSYDRLGQILAASIEHYHTHWNRDSHPLQIAPIANIFSPEDFGPQGFNALLRSYSERPAVIKHKQLNPVIEYLLRKIRKIKSGFGKTFFA